jgi:hypothetical protein
MLTLMGKTTQSTVVSGEVMGEPIRWRLLLSIGQVQASAASVIKGQMGQRRWNPENGQALRIT